MLAAVNVLGVRPGVRLVEVVTVGEAAAAAGRWSACGIWFVNPGYLRWPGMPAASAIGKTAIVLIFAFVGLEIALVPSGEVRDPARTVPRALFSALAITTTLYLLIQTRGAGTARTVDGDLRDRAARRSGRPRARPGRPPAGAARRGRLDVRLRRRATCSAARARCSRSPATACCRRRSRASIRAFTRRTSRSSIYACIVATVSISSSFTQLAVLANVAALTLYLMCVAASYELQRRDVRADGGDPVRGARRTGRSRSWRPAVIVWLLSNATRREFGVEALVLAVATLFYFIRKTGGQL